MTSNGQGRLLSLNFPNDENLAFVRDESMEDNTSRSLLRSCFCRSGLGVSGGDSLNPKTTTVYHLSDTEGGGLGGAKGGAAVECAALCETTAAMLLETLTLSVDISLSGS